MGPGRDDEGKFRIEVARAHAKLSADLEALKELVLRLERGIIAHDLWAREKEAKIADDLVRLKGDAIKIRTQAGMIAFLVGTFGVTLVEFIFRK